MITHAYGQIMSEPCWLWACGLHKAYVVGIGAVDIHGAGTVGRRKATARGRGRGRITVALREVVHHCKRKISKLYSGRHET